MRTLRLALGQINTTVGDLDGNTSKVIAYIKQARSMEADLVAFPEMAITGYPPEDLLLKPSFIEDNLDRMHQVIASSKGITVVVGFADADSNIYNAAAIGRDEKLVGVYHKMYLPNYGVFDEERYFKAGTKCPVFIIDGVPIGINICEDIWYASGPTSVQSQSGAQVIININASPYHAGKPLTRENMISTRASDNEVYIAYTNLVGGQDELVFDGGSTIFSPDGQLLARGKQLQEDLIVADIDLSLASRDGNEDFKPRNRPQTSDPVGEPVVVRISEYTPTQEKRPAIKSIGELLNPLDEIYSALVLGTKDYVQKNHFDNVVIGLSGGIDSSITAVIASDALGAENVIGVAMPSRYSSKESLLDARTLAENLNIRFMTVPIEPAFESLIEMLSTEFKDTKVGTAEENLQARIRGNILMALSNKFGWIVLTTGNKSETSVGYTTLYGDMAGGFAVIKDVPKTLVYELAQYRNNQREPYNIIPQSIITKAPTAELRYNQADQDTLPPYDILDSILKSYVEENRSYMDIVRLGFDSNTVQSVINMVDHNEYKRRQSPPGIKITPRAFGRDRRLPIVNSYRQF